jgi:hypothetical protein
MVGMGTCDAQNLTGNLILTSQLMILNEEFKLPPTSNSWSWGLTDGTSCGIRIMNNGVLTGRQAGLGGGGTILTTLNSGTNMSAVLCNDPVGVGGGSYIRAYGVSAHNSGIGTLANGTIYLDNLFDSSKFENVYATNSNGPSWNVNNACCGTSFEHINAQNSGGGPAFLLTASDAVSIKSSTISTSAVGYNALKMVGDTGVEVSGETYQEKSGADTATPLNYIDSTSRGIFFISGFSNPSTGSAQIIFENHTNGGFSIHGWTYSNSTYPINDVSAGISMVNYGGAIQRYDNAQTGMDIDYNLGVTSLYLNNGYGTFLPAMATYTDNYTRFLTSTGYAWRFWNNGTDIAQISGSGQGNFNGVGPSFSSPSILWTIGSGAPSGTCSSGSLYTRTDSTGGAYVCKNTAWSLVTSVP